MLHFLLLFFYFVCLLVHLSCDDKRERDENFFTHRNSNTFCLLYTTTFHLNMLAKKRLHLKWQSERRERAAAGNIYTTYVHTQYVHSKNEQQQLNNNNIARETASSDPFSRCRCSPSARHHSIHSMYVNNHIYTYISSYTKSFIPFFIFFFCRGRSNKTHFLLLLPLFRILLSAHFVYMCV